MSYRVAVWHEDADHHNSEIAHFGPAFNETYADIVFHATGMEVDLLAEAQKAADKFLADQDEDGWHAGVVELKPEGDGDTATWSSVGDAGGALTKKLKKGAA